MLNLKRKPTEKLQEPKRISHWRNKWYIHPELAARPIAAAFLANGDSVGCDLYVGCKPYPTEDEALANASQTQGLCSQILPELGFPVSHMCFIEAVPFHE